jgi:hypothetical protein
MRRRARDGGTKRWADAAVDAADRPHGNGRLTGVCRGQLVNAWPADSRSGVCRGGRAGGVCLGMPCRRPGQGSGTGPVWRPLRAVLPRLRAVSPRLRAPIRGRGLGPSLTPP